MARVFIDVSIFGFSWFKETLFELRNCSHVKFVVSRDRKMLGEIERATKLAQFHQLMAAQNRLEVVPAASAGPRVEFLESHPAWTANHKVCDDPHIFAMVFERPTRYIFSNDDRLARCRNRLNRSIDHRYCGFIVIHDATTYMRHRSRILRE